MVSQGRHRASTTAQNCYLALSARRHRWTTFHQLAHDLAAVSGREISKKTLYRRLAKTILYTRSPVLRVPLIASNRKDRMLKTSVVDTT
ncbi:hypothetical protein TNCV_2857861 [Trichonephila clavipes]|nr:hypothetical protein TNCV_2857861 [Trichonephila clavipes]